MTWFLLLTDLDVWDDIENDLTFPSKLVYESWFQNPSKNGMNMIEEIFN